jgi:hypothetical protein
MWLNNETKDALNYFWEMAGETETYPRSLERSILLALPIAIIKLPYLALGNIEYWLRFRNIDYSFDCQSRPVRGCLIAFQGKGLIFCDGSDKPDEIRFTISHEAAHFLLDHLMPRYKAIKHFGSSIIEVMDGTRKPSITERISSLLEGVNIGMVMNLMEREKQEDPGNVWRLEEQADRLALELLAPSKDVLAQSNISATDFNNRLHSITQSLILNFGLPILIAESYGENLLRSINKGPSFMEAIRTSR